MNDAIQAHVSRRHYRMALITLCAVYFLILVGSSVRASGAGMGCPDWPTCFGQWIPPLHESELPANYQEIYADLGYAETRFNVVKTWTEYANRLTGVTIGFLIFLTMILSFPVRKFDRAVTNASIAAFLMVGFQGWLGAKVVSSNLLPGMITVHMLMALAIVGVLIYAMARSRRGYVAPESISSLDGGFEKWLYIVLAMTLLQVALGTQVREMTDHLSKIQGEELRTNWIQAMPWFFYVHRSFSALVLLANLWLVRLLVTSVGWNHTLTRLTMAMVVVIVLAIVTGATLGHLGMPAFVQPTHLLAASVLFGLQFIIWMRYRDSRQAGRLVEATV